MQFRLQPCLDRPPGSAATWEAADACMPVIQGRKYAFKCHRKAENGKDVVYPINAMSFHPRYGTFATGGAQFEKSAFLKR